MSATDDFCHVCTKQPRPFAGFVTLKGVKACKLCSRPFCPKHKAQKGDDICNADHEDYARNNPGREGVYASLAARDVAMGGPKPAESMTAYKHAQEGAHGYGQEDYDSVRPACGCWTWLLGGVGMAFVCSGCECSCCGCHVP